ncbi:MAG: beta-galactosidase [Acidovorax sp.]|nr:beta-galactosidase [Acidovorax sp.]
MNKFFRAAALLVCALSLASHAASDKLVSTVIVLPTDLSQNPRIGSQLQNRGINHATVYVNWADAEPKEGEIDFSAYDRQFDPLVKDGLSLIIVLDMGGRVYFDNTGKLHPHLTTVPAWMRAKHPEGFMKNFSGEPTAQPDFMNTSIRKHSSRFLSRAVEYFSQRYPQKVLGYAIAIQEEHEIKYGQNGYQWRDHGEAATAAFYKQTGSQPPVINYNNSIATGLPKHEPLLHAHKKFREDRLKDAICFYAGTIREKGGTAMGYFAETFTSHDAIYATGVVENLAECIDIAVIDYNFYDGYRLVPDADVLPMLASYMGSVGYKKVMVGAYAERWELHKKTAEIIPVINRSISKALMQPHVIGYEIGGIQRQEAPGQPSTVDVDRLKSIAVTQEKQPLAGEGKSSRLRIGILGSSSNFYTWHGDRSGGTNPHRDALLQAYKILSSRPELDVHVIGEKNLQKDDTLLQQLDAVLIPHQAALPQTLKSSLAAYWKNGGALIQDMRLGEFDENGKPTFDWMHEVFGIASIDWRRGNIFLLDDGKILRLKPSRRYTGYASMTPRPGYKILGKELLNKQRGIMVRGERTLVFGLTPQLVDDTTRDEWHKLFVQEIINTIPSRAR